MKCVTRDPQVVVVLELGWLGDSIMALPAMRALRTSMPRARLVRVCNARLVPFFEECPWIDELLPYDKGAPKAQAGLDLLRRIRALHPTHFFNLHTPDFDRPLSLYVRDNLFARATRAEIRAAYFHSLDRLLLTHGVARGLFGRARMDQEILRVVEPFAQAHTGSPFAFWHDEKDETEAGVLIARGLSAVGQVPDAGFFAVAPFGKRVTREWSYERLAKAMIRISVATGLVPVVLGAFGDHSKMDRLSGHVESPLVDLVGQTSIKLAAAVMARSRFVLAIDSGLMHLAALAGRPIVALFGPGNPERWRPLPQVPVAIVQSGADCAPCFRDTCSDLRCQDAMSVERVVAAALEILTRAECVQLVVERTGASSSLRLTMVERAGNEYSHRWNAAVNPW